MNIKKEILKGNVISPMESRDIANIRREIIAEANA